MRIAKIVFLVAGVWGIVVLTPLYWLVYIAGRHYNPPADYPQFFYGFFSVAMAWQIAFLVIASDPVRYRPMMIVGMIEKFGHVATVTTLYLRHRISTIDLQAAFPDLVLGLAFIWAFAATRRLRAATWG